jgi:ABC-type phosphate transport system substrate-binding protein
VSNAGALRSVVDVLGSIAGISVMAVLAVVLVGLPFLDRWVIRRRRIQYQVLYNSKIGLDTVFTEHDEDEEPTPTNPLGRLVHELEHLSVMLIRIRNVGSADIEESDIRPPLSVAFGNRVIWNARVSEASSDELRSHIRENLEFFTHVGWLTAAELNAMLPETETGYDYRNLSVVRRWLVQRLAKALTQGADVTPSTEPEPEWHGVRLSRLWLKRQQSFILMVVLREAAWETEEISKDYEVTGGLTARKTIIQQRRQDPFRWPIVTTAIGVIVVGALLGTVLAKAIVGVQPPLAGNVQCVAGTVSLAGSSAFGPIAQTIGDQYAASCPGAHVNVNTNGSIDGVRSLVGSGPRSAATQAALSDGPSAEAPDGMGRQQLVVLVYALVVNKDVGVDHLSRTQVAGIFNGTYTNWQQLGGISMPIRIVARESGSGTRHTLEKYVLNGSSEGVASSGSCLKKDDVATAPTILCELPTTAEVVSNVSTVPGAIGYADVSNKDTKAAVATKRIMPVVLDGLAPNVRSVPQYPFWTVEYLYTWTPATTSPVAAYQDYLKTDTAQKTLQDAGYKACEAANGQPNPLCAQR